MSGRIICGDSRTILASLPDESVHCVVTSPPYWGLRDYGVDGQLGLEKSPQEYLESLVSIFREVRRVLRGDGTLWLNIGDSYAGSGRGGNPDAGTKQGTNCGSQTIGVLYGRENDSAEQERTRIKEQFAATKDAGLKPKDLVGIPWRVAFALQADGWWLRQDIIWSKPNPMPESVTDRCTKAHEYIFMLSKSQRYHYDAQAIEEPGVSNRPDMATKGIRTGLAYLQQGSVASNSRKPDKQRGHSRRHAGFNDRWDEMEKAEKCSGMRNKRSVWTVATQPLKEAHFATFPPALIEPCILAGCPKDGTVLDPFFGSGTTGLVCERLQRNFIGIELNPEYAAMAERRIHDDSPMFAQTESVAA